MDAIDHWAHLLTGESRERIEDSRARIESFGIEHLTEELARREDIDAAAGGCMLASAIEELSKRGIPMTKIEGKLRGDPDVWPSVTELVAAAFLAKVTIDPEAGIELDARSKAGGSRPDLRLTFPDLDNGATFEFKALSLSAGETRFFAQAATVLPAMCPSWGFATQHIDIDRSGDLYAPSRAERRADELQNRRAMRKLPAGAPRHIAAAVVAAHYSEQKYLERARDRVEEAIQQLPKGDDCWVALWWTNGAPLGSMRQLLTTIDFPPHILGIVLLGAVVVFPDPEIHYYHFFIPRDLSEDERPKVVSLVDHPFAEKILEIVEESSGVRPTLIVHPEGTRQRRQRVLFRDGQRRLFPFNLVLDRDPPGIREAAAFEGDPSEEERVARGVVPDARRIH